MENDNIFGRIVEAVIATFTGTVFLTCEELSEYLAGHIGMKSQAP